MTDDILTPEEKQRIKADVFTEYSRLWGDPRQQELIIVLRTIECINKILGETGRLDA